MRTPAGFVQVPTKAVAAVDLVVCRPPDALGFIAAAACGDLHAARIVVALNDALHRIDAAPRHAPLLCATCPQILRTSP